VLHDLLQRQLEELGITDPTNNPPDHGTWRRLLEVVTESYHRADDRLMYHALFEQTTDAVFIIDFDGKYLATNHKAAEMLGYSVIELVGMYVKDVVTPDQFSDSQSVIQSLLEGKQLPPYERMFRKKDGTIFPVEVNVQLVRDNLATPLYVQSVVRDITERKRAEAAIHFQAALVDHMHDAVIATDMQFCIVTWNSAAERMYGWTADEVLGKNAIEVTTPHLTPEQQQEIWRTLIEQNYWEGEVLHQHRNGKPLDVLGSLSLLRDKNGEPSGLIGIDRDITARKQSQEALQSSQEKYRQLFNAAQWQAQELTLLNRVRAAVAQELDLAPLVRTIVKVIAETFDYTHVSLYLRQGDNLILYHQIGYEVPYPVISLHEGIIGRTVRLGEPAFVENTDDDPDYLSAATGVSAEICVPLFDRDQVVGVFNIESTVEKTLTNDDMRLMIALGEQLSIAVERARLYTSLRESKEQYQNVLDSVREVIFQTDERGCWSFLNPAWVEITGYSVEESLGRACLDIVYPDDRPLTASQYRPLVKEEIPFTRYETRIVTKDGEPRWVEVHARPTAYVQGQMRGLSGTLTDITERKRSEQQAAELLAQSHTVDALRRFLNNMSHDLRTPLSVMNTSLYLLRRKFNDPDTAIRHLTVLEAQVIHLTRIVEDLVEMSRLEDQVVEFEFISVHLGNLVRDVTISYETIVQEKGLTLLRESDPGLPSIRADQVWVGRLVHNLLTNAIQYTPDNGTICLKTTSRDGGVLLEVCDTGIGISPQDLPFIFDRFYRADTARPSTKGGAGLGLAIVQKVVDVHGGRVEVESIVGQGSAFRVWFPLNHE
jgi:PAS domain S-box-containing protein